MAIESVTTKAGDFEYAIEVNLPDGDSDEAVLAWVMANVEGCDEAQARGIIANGYFSYTRSAKLQGAKSKVLNLLKKGKGKQSKEVKEAVEAHQESALKSVPGSGKRATGKSKAKKLELIAEFEAGTKTLEELGAELGIQS